MAAEKVVAEAAAALKLATTSNENTLATYLGISFAMFLGFIPRSAISLVPSLQSRNRALSIKLIRAEEQLAQMKCRRKEDSKANARVVEIFASHRNGWQQEERRLLEQIEAHVEEIAHLRAKVEVLEKSESELRMCCERLQREVDEREEMINFMSRQAREEEEEYFGVRSVEKLEVRSESEGWQQGGYGRCVEEEENEEFRSHCVDYSKRFGDMRVSDGLDSVSEEFFMDRDGDGGEMPVHFGAQNGFNSDFLTSASKIWAERTSDRQDIPYDSLESHNLMKHFVARRESPWKVDSESTGVPSKLNLLEQELQNLEKISNGGELLKVPSLLRKQAKRYKGLAGRIDDLCRRMQANDPCEASLSTEFQTRRQTEFLLEAHRLQQRATEAGQKLTALQTETTKSSFGHDDDGHAKLMTKRSLDSIRNNFKDIQRNLEIWLARIMGDLEGILARDGASRVREYYISSYPFVSPIVSLDDPPICRAAILNTEGRSEETIEGGGGSHSSTPRCMTTRISMRVNGFTPSLDGFLAPSLGV